MNTDALTEQILSYLDGGLPPDAERRLVERVRGDAEAERLLADLMRIHGNIPVVLEELRTENRNLRVPAGELRRRRKRPFALPADRPTATGWWWGTGLAAALLVAVGLLVGRSLKTVGPLRGPKPVLARVAEVQGRVLADTGRGPAVIRAGHPVTRGETVTTGGGGSSAQIVLADGSHFRLTPDSAVTVGGGPAPLRAAPAVNVENRMHLARGRLEADIRKRAAGDWLLFTTEHADILVRGTRFAIELRREATHLRMLDGEVEAVNRRTGAPLVLRAGDYAIIGATTRLASDAATVPGQAAAARTRDGLLALYTFLEGKGATVHDVSGVGKALDLQIEDSAAVRWLPGGGLATHAPTLIASPGAARKVIDACRRSHALTVEAWVKPGYEDPPSFGARNPNWPRRIASVSKDGENCNFVLGQGGRRAPGTCYFLLLRTTRTSNVGVPANRSEPNTARTQLTHVVWTRSAGGEIVVYLDGARHAASQLAGDFSNWDRSFRFALANEFGAPRYDRAWLGEYYLIAVYDRALSQADVARNHQAGRGEYARSARR